LQTLPIFAVLSGRERGDELRPELSSFPIVDEVHRYVKTGCCSGILETDRCDGPGCGGSMQYLLPSPLHIAMSPQRILKRIGHGQPPRRDQIKRVKGRIVPIIGIRRDPTVRPRSSPATPSRRRARKNHGSFMAEMPPGNGPRDCAPIDAHSSRCAPHRACRERIPRTSRVRW
jgi:hypothetical protein